MATLALGTPALAQLDPDDPTQLEPPVAPDTPETPDPSDEEVETLLLLLSGYHGLPEAELFESQLNDPRPMLWMLALDEGVFPLYRERALAALCYWPDATLEAHLRDVAMDVQTPEISRHQAIGLLASTFPYTAGTEVALSVLDDTDVQLRLSAIAALAQIGSVDAIQALNDRLAVEDHPVVARAIEDELARGVLR